MRWTIVVALPLVIVAASIRLLLTDTALGILYVVGGMDRVEARWSYAERLGLATASLRFLQTDEGVEYFDSLEKPDGAVLYTAAEISHLVDVKQRVDMILLVGSFAFGYVCVVGGYLCWRGQLARLAQYMRWGAGLTLTVILCSIVGILLAWDWLFITFHEVLFPRGNWTFAAESSLIRLFPEHFWFTFGIAWVGLIAGLSVILIVVSWLVQNRYRLQAK